MTEQAKHVSPTDQLQPPKEKKYYHDPGGDKQRARARRINDLLAAAGGPKGVVDWAYWELVYDNEEAPMTTDAAELRAAGFELVESSSLDDAQLTAKLDELLRELDRMNVAVIFHEHVSRRELYELLVGRLLHQERRDVPVRDGEGWTIDISSACPPEDENDALKVWGGGRSERFFSGDPIDHPSFFPLAD